LPEVRMQLEQRSLATEGSGPRDLAIAMQGGVRAWERFVRDNDLAER
jgi:hypothetical protein